MTGASFESAVLGGILAVLVFGLVGIAALYADWRRHDHRDGPEAA